MRIRPIAAANVVNQSSENLSVERPCGRNFEFEVVSSTGTVVLTTNGRVFPCVADSTSAAVVLPPVIRPSGATRRSRAVTVPSA